MACSSTSVHVAKVHLSQWLMMLWPESLTHCSNIADSVSDVLLLSVAVLQETPEALVQFVKEHDQVLADLGDDERAVLNTFGEWPEERYALLQEVAAAHK